MTPPANLRLAGLGAANDTVDTGTPDIVIDLGDNSPVTDQIGDIPEYDDKGAVIRITHADASVTVSTDGRPLKPAPQSADAGWFDNLVDHISTSELGRISESLLRGIQYDQTSRQEWVETRAQGLNLLGVKIKLPGVAGAAEGAPVEGMSKVQHPLLLEAVLRFQANARSELLPTDGPAKIRDDDNNVTTDEDHLADALEMDLNHFLTHVATEYYPDTDRMLFLTGFGGDGFKKVYFCPIRNRPASESVDANDLIVDNEATDLKNARRITHRIMMRPSTVKRMQILGIYRDIDLSAPTSPSLNSVDREKSAQQGVQANSSTDPADRDREIYECCCELDIDGFKHAKGGKDTGLEIPYRVTIDVSSCEILSIVRNYKQETEALPEACSMYVKYPYVPGLGFYDLGLVHILGNTTNALTAAWREMLDNGMFANFPGFLVAQSSMRQRTNLVRVAPGSGAPIETGGKPIQSAVMPLPYNTSGMPALMSLVQDISATGQRLGGTAEVAVGEGRADAPVGTTLALIEQATKIENAVHKRLWSAQAEELNLILDCFREHPESFWQRKGRSAQVWDQDTFMRAVENVNLVPQADPNTASRTQRLMKAMALAQGAQQAPQLYNLQEVNKTVLTEIGWPNPERFLNPTPAPNPKVLSAQADIKEGEAKSQADTMRAQASMITAKAREAEVAHTAEQGGYGAPQGLGQDSGQQVDTPVDHMTAQAKLEDAKTRRMALGIQQHDTELEDQNRDQDRAAKTHLAVLDLAKDLIGKQVDPGQVGTETTDIAKDAGV